MKDLHFGDVHLFPVPVAELNTVYPSLDSSSTSFQISIALIVAQKRSRDGQISSIDWQTLQAGLALIAAECRRPNQLRSCVAMPRMSQSTVDWYKTERIIRRYLVDRGRLPTFVYYHPRGRRQHTASITNLNSSIPQAVTIPSHPVSRQPINELFNGCTIYFGIPDSYAEQMRSKEYQRRVLAYGGQITTDPDQATHVVCIGTPATEKPTNAKAVKVSEKWIYDSILAGKLIK
jgi:hypothetical protein